MKLTIIILSVASVLVGAAAIALSLYTSQPPVPDAKFQQIGSGMSGKEVREILGTPTSIVYVTNDAAAGAPGTNVGAQWIYSRSLPWSEKWVYVMFSNDVVTAKSKDRFP